MQLLAERYCSHAWPQTETVDKPEAIHQTVGKRFLIEGGAV
jgi:hypothetical protein